MITRLLLLLTNVIAFASIQHAKAQHSASAIPASPKQPVTDTYFGKTVTDNYRWLEDMEKQEVQDWFKAQGDYTAKTLDQIPGRDSLINTLVKYDALKASRISGVWRRAGRYFYRKTLASESVGKIYYRQGKNGQEILLFDPTTYDKTKKYTVSGYSPSEDGRMIVIGLTEGGAEVSTLKVMNVDTKTFLADNITPIWNGAGSWSPDSKGFMYNLLNSADSKDAKRSLNTKTFYHVVGTDTKTDREVLSAAKYPTLGIKPEEYPYVFYTEDFRYIVGLLGTVDQRMNCFIAPASDLLKPTIAWKPLIEPKDSVKNMYLIGNQLYLHSIKGTNKGQILAMDENKPDLKTAKVVLPSGKLKIDNISASKDYLFVALTDGINTSIQQYNPKITKWEDIPLPIKGTAGVWAYEPTSNDCQLIVTSWKQPATLYEYDPVSRKATPSPFDITVTYPGTSDIVVEEVEIPSHDGKMVPLSIMYNKNVKRDGKAVCFMTGYGAYGSSATPFFSTRMLSLLNKGVIVAETHPRGGSEKGEDWYKAGYKTTKPNTWKDFIASGEYLIKKGYTSAGKLIGEGTSAGGILIGRAITERPDLFAAAISNVSCSNALRMENSANGPVNAPEFGTVKDSTECMALYEMDAFQHVKEGTNYPAVLCIGGMNDPRVVAWQPGKFAAALQNASKSGKPVLLQVNYDNGHFTEDKKVTFRNFANMYAFALWQAGHPDFQPAVDQAKLTTGNK